MSRITLIGLFVFVASHALAADTPAPGNAKVISRAVGEVGEHVVTSREVLITQAVHRALDEKSEAKTPDAKTDEPKSLAGDDKAQPAQVYYALDEWSVYLEAKALNEKGVSRAEQAEAMKKVEAHWAGKPAWTALEVSNEELRDLIERHLIASEFEKLKSDPQLAPVSDDDALAYYRKNRLRFGNLPFSDMKDNIKTFLVKSQTERRLSEWRDILRRKYRVRNFIAG